MTTKQYTAMIQINTKPEPIKKGAVLTDEQIEKFDKKTLKKFVDAGHLKTTRITKRKNTEATNG